jgi:hypothetical protein
MARRLLSLFVVFCVAAALLPAVASAHDPTTTRTEITRRESYQVKVGEERVVTGYKDGDRIAPFTETYEEEEEYTVQGITGYKDGDRIAPFTETYEEEEEYTVQVIAGYEEVRVEPRYILVPAFNYVNVPQYEDVVTKRFTGNKKVRIPPYTKRKRVAPFTKSIEVFNYETVCVGGPGGGCIQVRVEPRYISVPAFNYVDVPAFYYVNVPQYEDVVTQRFTGYKKTRIPPYTKTKEVFNYENQPVYGPETRTRTVTRTRDVFNYEQIPVYGFVTRTRTVTRTRDVFNYEQIPIYGNKPKYETRYRTVGTGKYETTATHDAHPCPAGYYAPPLPNPMWIHITTGELTTDLNSVGIQTRTLYDLAVWEKQDETHDCHKPVRRLGSPVDVAAIVKKVVVNGVEHVANAGKVVIGGVEYVVENGKIVIDQISDIGDTLREEIIDGFEEALKQTARVGAQGICRDVVTVAAAGTVITAGLLLAGVTGGTSVIAGFASAVWIGVACENIGTWLQATSDSDDSDDDSRATPTPTPTATPTPTPTATPTPRPFDKDRDCYRYVPPTGGIGARCFIFKDGQLVVTFPDREEE